MLIDLKKHNFLLTPSPVLKNNYTNNVRGYHGDLGREPTSNYCLSATPLPTLIRSRGHPAVSRGCLQLFDFPTLSEGRAYVRLGTHMLTVCSLATSQCSRTLTGMSKPRSKPIKITTLICSYFLKINFLTINSL